MAEESWPPVRNADELHDALLTFIACPPSAQWTLYFNSLAAARRATEVQSGNALFWVAAERLTTARVLYPGSTCTPPIEAVERSVPEDRDAAATVAVRGWLESTGPTTALAGCNCWR